MATLTGWRFEPFDDELLDSFLRKKILGLPLSYHLIVEADVYSDDPKSLIARYHTPNRYNEWYFFTSTTRKHPIATDSGRASRCAGAGRWKATQRIKTVLDSDHNVLGSKQSFCYMERCSSSGGETKSIWLMKEYSIHDLRRKAVASGSNQLDEWVICKIYLTPKARKDHMTQQDLHEIQPAERFAPEPATKRRRMEKPQTMSSHIAGLCQILQPPDHALPQLIDVSGTSIDGCSPAQYANEDSSTPSQDIADSFQIYQLADDTFMHSDLAVPVLGETISSLCMHPGQNITAHCHISQLPDDAPPQLNYVPSTPINGCSPTQHAGEELSIPREDIANSFQIHQLVDDILPPCDLAVPVPVEIMSIPCIHPSQDIAGLSQILQLPDDDLPQLIDVSGTSIDSCSPIQHASGELFIPSENIYDSFQNHQLAEDTLPHTDLAMSALVDTMEGPEHVSRLANFDQQFLKDITADNSSIPFSPEIMQVDDDEIEQMTALLRSLHDDLPMPSIDDILRWLTE